MGNYYCKNCGVPLDYYNVKHRHHMRPSCRCIKLEQDSGCNTYHEWHYFMFFKKIK